MCKQKILLLFFLTLVVACGHCYAQPYQPVQHLPENIIDMHVHIAGVGSKNSGCFVSATMRKDWRFKLYLRSFDVSEKEILAQGDMLIADKMSKLLVESHYVSRAVILALDGVVDANGNLDFANTEIYVPNEFVVRAVAQHKNFLFGASINPYRKDAIQRIHWAKEHGAVLVKWIPAIMNIDPSDPKIIPFYRELVKLDLPLLTHTGFERSFPKVNNQYCDPEKLRLPLSLGVKVIAAHIASVGKYSGERSTDRLARLMLEFPNLYSDISSLTQFDKLRYLKEALTRNEFKNRLVYGSDFPLINTALVSPWFYVKRLGIKKAREIASLKNPWDRDVKLKQELGTPSDVFSRFNALFMQGNN